MLFNILSAFAHYSSLANILLGLKKWLNGKYDKPTSIFPLS